MFSCVARRSLNYESTGDPGGRPSTPLRKGGCRINTQLGHPERIPTPAQILEWVDERQRRELEDAKLLAPRYNIAPSQSVLIAGRDPDGAWSVHPATWGFRPHWLPADRKAPINARAETVADKPMFRGALRKARCLVPADGWYEWQPQPQGPKVPHFFRRPDDGVFWFAGLKAAGADGERTMAILTTDANAVAKAVHGRMPVVLPDGAAASAWADPEAADSTLRDLMVPVADDLVETYPIGRAVNRPQNDGPELIEPAAV